ncbi:MAG: hypothetical protein V2A34_02765, partial [Lentisphaerota bacterium]
LSAAVYPGAGQFYQRRWVAGSLFVVLFSVVLVILLYNVLHPMFHNLSVVIDWGSDHMKEPLETISWPSIFIPFFLGLILFVVNLVDVVSAEKRRNVKERLNGRAGA